MKYILMVAVMALLCTPAAGDLLAEVMPDEATLSLMVDKELDGKARAIASWEAFEFGPLVTWGDVWSVDPLGIGASLGLRSKRIRFGAGYDACLHSPVLYIRLKRW